MLYFVEKEKYSQYYMVFASKFSIIAQCDKHKFHFLNFSKFSQWIILIFSSIWRQEHILKDCVNRACGDFLNPEFHSRTLWGMKQEAVQIFYQDSSWVHFPFSQWAKREVFPLLILELILKQTMSSQSHPYTLLMSELSHQDVSSRIWHIPVCISMSNWCLKNVWPNV